jgi:hypothetical protein
MISGSFRCTRAPLKVQQKDGAETVSAAQEI